MTDSTKNTLQNFINGQFAPPQTGNYIDNICPSTGQVYGKIPDSTAADVNAAVDAASSAFATWSRTPASERSKILLKIAQLVEDRIPQFAQAESLDQGKTVALATHIDIPRVVSNFRFFATAILHHEEMSLCNDDETVMYTRLEPCGVAGLISPWNLPLYLLSWKIAPCIAWGNTCVCKPSEFTSVTAHMLCQVFAEAGLPNGVVNVVFGTGLNAGAPLVQHKDVPLISFTGGTVTARKIAADAAVHFKKMSLELGGKNPNIIFDDADLDAAIARTKFSSFANQGEICLCGSRIFVQKGVYDEFVKRFVELTKTIQVGDPKDSNSFMGALVSKQHLEKVAYYVDLAKKEGGKIEVGGKKPTVKGFEDGFWFEPTIITGLTPNCRVMQEEIFGPVVTITPFETEDEVVEYANGVEYGLSSSVWTTDVRKAHRVARKLHCGTVWVNCWLVRDLRVPFGGTKNSGIGREGGKYSQEFFTEPKTVCIRY